MTEKTSQLGGGKDPSGSVHERDGSIFRDIVPEFTSFFQSVLDNTTVQGMIGHELVGTTTESAGKAGGSLKLQHEKISPAAYPYEWPSAMLHDAARLTLEICVKLLDEGWILKDATPWNVIFDGGRPVLIDFASIMPIDKDLVWVALDQFSRLFLFPLLAAEQGFGRDVRALLMASQAGISSNEIGNYLPPLAWAKKGWLIKRIYLPLMVVGMLQRSGQDKEIGKYIKNNEVAPVVRMKFFTNLMKDLNSIHFKIGKSRWSRYYSDVETFFNPEQFNQKQKVTADLMRKLKPKTVTDIGSNMGGYAVLAALEGARVTAFDMDEDSINMFYSLVKERGLAITPLVLDVTNPSPAAGWRGRQYPGAVERFRSEGALALALVHHLAITQGQYFDRIAEELADYCDKWLLTEFVPPEDERTKELLLTCRRDVSWYTLDGYVSALKKKFKKITTFDSYPKGRTLILCEQKIKR